MKTNMCAKVIQVDVGNGKVRILREKKDSSQKEDTALNNVLRNAKGTPCAECS